MTITETYCTSCGKTVRTETPHCPECGAEESWDERPAYRFDEDDLPLVVSHEFYDDTYGLWSSYCSQYFGNAELNGSDIDGLPDEFPQMKYCVVEVYFVVTEDYDLEGPFLDRKEARAVPQEDSTE